MKGTILSATIPILFIPPNIISPAIDASTTPTTIVGTPKLVFNASAIELTCVIFPMPKEAINVKKAKRIASILPSFFRPSCLPTPLSR